MIPEIIRSEQLGPQPDMTAVRFADFPRAFQRRSSQIKLNTWQN